MRTLLIVILPPAFNLSSRVTETREPVRVQTFISEPAVETFHKGILHRLARLTSRSAEDAEDALQEAMVSAHRGAASFRHHAAVSSWLHRIVVNACLDRLRRNKTHPTTVLDDRYPVPDRTAQVDTAIAVQRALMRLPVEQRAAVVAVDMHGYSVADTAQLLGVAEGTVKSRCARARARLAAILGYLHSDTHRPAG